MYEHNKSCYSINNFTENKIIWASNKLTVSDLDFDNVKSNLKTFLQSQSEFQDYDFEGSGLLSY